VNPYESLLQQLIYEISTLHYGKRLVLPGEFLGEKRLDPVIAKIVDENNLLDETSGTPLEHATHAPGIPCVELSFSNPAPSRDSSRLCIASALKNTASEQNSSVADL
jgi:hypothetical protein